MGYTAQQMTQAKAAKQRNEIARLTQSLEAVTQESIDRRKQIEALEAEVARLVKRFSPRRLRYAPKDRVIIGVERPPYEDDTFFYDLIWSEDRQQFVTPFVNALNGATHFLDPRDLIGLPPQERLSRAERKQANAQGEQT